jgi:hypothetical protein
MMHLQVTNSLNVGLQCVGQVYELLNPGQTFKIIGTIKEIMHITVLVQLNMLTWLLKTSLPGPPAALLMLLETYQSLQLGAIQQELASAASWELGCKTLI